MTSSKRLSPILSCIAGILLFIASPTLAQEGDKDEFYMAVEQMPKLYGSIDSLHNELTYTNEAAKAEVEGRVMVQFIVNKEGEVEYPEVIRGIGHGLDEEALRVIKTAKFTPGKQRGEKVRVRQSLALNYELEMPPPPKEEEEDENFFVAVEDMPKLKGGLARLQQKIQYPKMAKKAGIEGRVIVQFIVDDDGTVDNPKVIRGIGGGGDEEALRVVKQATFEPGRQRGKPVRVQYSLPITFQLPN